MKTVLGVFDNRLDAESAINELKDDGFDSRDISVVMRNRDEEGNLASDTGTNVMRGTVSGATTGGVIGAIAGLLTGVGALTIPGLGALLVGGPIAAALGLTGAAATTATGAAAGIVAGGLIGALTGLGVSAEDARTYEDRVKAGSILLAVDTDDEDIDDAETILKDNDAQEIRVVTEGKGRRSGRTTEVRSHR